MKAAITIDPWKLPIFKRHLEQSGYKFEQAGGPEGAFMTLSVETFSLEALATVVGAANDEAKKTGKPQ